MLWLVSKWKIHGWGWPDPWMGRKKKRKDKEYEKLRTKIICLTNKTQTYNALLDVESVAHDSWSLPPVHGSIHKLRSAYSKIPKRIPFSSPCPLFPYYWPTPTVGFSPYSRITGSTSMCKDPWMGIIHESRATYAFRSEGKNLFSFINYT